VVDSDVDEETEAVADEALVEEAARTRRKNGVCRISLHYYSNPF
jgi:hypothetical protein